MNPAGNRYQYLRMNGSGISRSESTLHKQPAAQEPNRPGLPPMMRVPMPSSRSGDSGAPSEMTVSRSRRRSLSRVGLPTRCIRVSPDWLRIKPYGNLPKAFRNGGIVGHYERIMSRNNVVGRIRKLPQDVVAIE